MTISKAITILAHAVVIWALCFATIGLSMKLTTQQNALIIHAAGAPIFAAVVSWVYFSRFCYTRPLQTALIFTIFIMALDFFVVALLILHNLEMFASPLGTWIPFALIFLATFVTGISLQKRTATAGA